eukprot:g11208.t1
MRVKFNWGAWTGEEHQGFLRGLGVYGRGILEAIGIFVPSRSSLQIEAHARDHFARIESARPEEVQVAAQRAPSGQASSSCSWSCSSASSGPSRDNGCGSSGGGGSSLWETQVVAHLVYGIHAFQQEEELCYRNIGIYDATAIGILDGLVAVENDGVPCPAAAAAAAAAWGGVPGRRTSRESGV